MIGNESIDPIERALAKKVGESTVQYDNESNSHPREILPVKMSSEMLIMKMQSQDRID